MSVIRLAKETRKKAVGHRLFSRSLRNSADNTDGSFVSSVLQKDLWQWWLQLFCTNNFTSSLF